MRSTDMKEDLSKLNILEVWLPGEGNSHNECFRVEHNGVDKIEAINEFHGDHDENWIIVHQGYLIHRINERQITEIVFKR